MKDTCLLNTIIKDRWAMVRLEPNRKTTLLGSGAFGQVYLSTDSQTSTTVAIKVECPGVKKPVLKLESQILKRLISPFIPKFIAVGRFVAPHIDEGVYTYLVMERLGSSVSEVRKTQPSQKFSIQTTALLGMQMVEGIKDLHAIGVVHRDIKPANFCLRETWPHCVLIDFGLSRKFLNSDGTVRNVRQIRNKQERENVGFRGTARYASIQAHFGKELGRVDDLWSLFYMVVEFLVGTLPWKGKEKDKIGDLKVIHTTSTLVQNLPPQLTHLLHYLSQLDYYSTPDYDYISSLFKELIGIPSTDSIDTVPGLAIRYDWEIKECREVALAAEPTSSSTLFRKSEGLSPVPPLSAPGKMLRPRRNYFWSSKSASTVQAVPTQRSNETMKMSSDVNIDISTPSTDPLLSESLVQKFSTLSDLGFCNPYTPQGWMESLLDNTHYFTGLEWGSSIIIGTVVLRFALLPIAIKAQRAMTRIKDFKPLMTVYQQRADELIAAGKQGEAKLVRQELFMDMKKKGFSPFAGLWGLIQIPFFISMFLALRRMADLPVEGFKEGGFLWFQDLTAMDSFYVLPALGGLSLLLAMEANRAMPMTDGGKLALRSISILSIAALSYLPSAVLLFTITSGGFTIFQTILLQNDKIKKILKFESNPELARDKNGKLHLPPLIEKTGNNSMLAFKPLSFLEARKAVNEHFRKISAPVKMDMNVQDGDKNEVELNLHPASAIPKIDAKPIPQPSHNQNSKLKFTQSLKQGKNMKSKHNLSKPKK